VVHHTWSIVPAVPPAALIAGAINKDIGPLATTHAFAPHTIVLTAVFIFLHPLTMPVTIHPFTNVLDSPGACELPLATFLAFVPLTTVLAPVLPGCVAMSFRKVVLELAYVLEASDTVAQGALPMALTVLVHTSVIEVSMPLLFCFCFIYGPASLFTSIDGNHN